MKVRIHQVDAFAERRFEGNPAAVVVLERFPEAAWMQAVADENKLAETAFVVPTGEPARFLLRWFTPTIEIDLCGHATLASAWILRERHGEHAPVLRFDTRSGELRVVACDDGRLELDLPARRLTPVTMDPVGSALGLAPESVLDSGVNYVAVYRTEEEVRTLRPDLRAVAAIPRHGVVVTARGARCDFVSRYFAPGVGVDEDPVTGSAHCELVPYWAAVLGRTSFRARQISRRGGELLCRLADPRVHLAGFVTPYLDGEIDAP